MRGGHDSDTREAYYEALCSWRGLRVLIQGPDGRVRAILEPDPEDPTLCHATLTRPCSGLEERMSWRCPAPAQVERFRAGDQ